MSTSNGDSSSWVHLPSVTLGTRPMDGPVIADSNNPRVIYMRTDWGLGASVDGGMTIEEMNDGITAVQVDGIALAASKNTAWVATKSGVTQNISAIIVDLHVDSSTVRNKDVRRMLKMRRTFKA